MIRGNLIVVEGIDGSGTTTLARNLEALFHAKSLAVHVTAQPSNGPVGMVIRQALNGRLVTLNSKAPGWATMSLLFAADRQDQQENEIEPILRDGVNIICDRYVQSSAVYQSESTQEEDALDWILEINKRIRKPDVVFYLKVSPAEALSRRTSRGGGVEIYDEQSFQAKLIKKYDRLREIFPDTLVIDLDAHLTPEELTEQAWKAIEVIRAKGAPDE